MRRWTLYAYLDGNDLHDIAPRIREELDRLVSSVRWKRRTWVVDERKPSTASASPDDLPDWDLGLNHELPDCGRDNAGWFADVEQIASRLDRVAAATGREFVVGIFDHETGVSDDACWLDGRGVDMAKFRALLGREPPRM